MSRYDKGSFFNFIIGFFLVIVAVMPALILAQDTEIYLGRNDTSDIRHNILFILDTSGSMKNAVPGTGLTRIQTLKQVMDSVVGSLSNMNVGYVRMNGSRNVNGTNPRIAGVDCDAAMLALGAEDFGNNDRNKPDFNNVCYIPTGGTVLFPVEDLDKDILAVAGVDLIVNTAIAVSASADDAQQAASLGAIELSETTLDIGSSRCPAANIRDINIPILAPGDDAAERGGTRAGLVGVVSGNRPTIFLSSSTIAAFRFRFLAENRLSQDTLILASNIVFSSNTDGGRGLDLVISRATNLASNTNIDVEDTASSISFTLSNIPLDNAVVTWDEVNFRPPVRTLTTPDLSDLLQDALNSPDWNDQVLFLISPPDISSNDLTRRFPANAGTTAATQVLPLSSLSVSYCEQQPSATEQNIGLRFQNVAVPKGAQIASAFIDFTAAFPALNTPTGSSASSVAIRGHDVDDSPDFSTTDINTRTETTANTNWTAQAMGEWDDESAYSSPDLRNIVSEIVSRDDWCGGNAMSFILKAGLTSDLLRRARSFDDDPASSPVLRVSYTNSLAVDDGCNNRTAVLALTSQSRIGEEVRDFIETNNGTVPITGLSANAFNPRVTGFVFPVPVAQGATIMSAELQLTYAGPQVSNPPYVQIAAEASDDAERFVEGFLQDGLQATNRARVTGSGVPVQGSDVEPLSTADANTPFRLPVAPLVQAVVNRPGWAAGNNMALFLETAQVTSASDIRSVWGTGGAANSFEFLPTLRLTYQENNRNRTPITVRDRLLAINETFRLNRLLAWTPSVETFLEAALYWRGKPVLFGARRGAGALGVRQGVVVGIRTNGTDVIRDVDFTHYMDRTLTSHPGSWTGGTYDSDLTSNGLGFGACQFAYDLACARDGITGGAVYRSPITAENNCSRNFQIFLTDGKPTLTAKSTEDRIIAEFEGINSCSVDSAVNARGVKGRCAVEMLADMNTNDQNLAVDGVQTVRTYTIAFNLNDDASEDWLRQLAAAGGGAFSFANDVGQLQSAFDQILREIIQQPRAFTSPAISANAFNRLFSRDEIYFGLFQGETTPKWDGNLKKYNICVSTESGCTLGGVLDKNNRPAVVDGRFVTSSSSVWTMGNDGGELREGGAGAELTTGADIQRRIIYTVGNEFRVPSNGVLDVPLSGPRAGYKLTRAALVAAGRDGSGSFDHIYSRVCPDLPDTYTATDFLAGGTNSCDSRVRWMMGQDVRDEDEDGNTNEARWWFADVLHSSPVAVTYGMEADSDGGFKFIDRILVGTNDGAVHMIDGETGKEEWSFIPDELLFNQPRLYTNTGDRNVYGMDLTPVIRIVDENRNGIIKPSEGDLVHGYFGMRRGGSSYYALDLTPDNALTSVSSSSIGLGTTSPTIPPKFLWRIQAGAVADGDDFSRLGQTWSEPVVANIRCAVDSGRCPEGRKTVLIFGGGYDTNLDNDFGLQARSPNVGNAIYIFDPDEDIGTGSSLGLSSNDRRLLLSISHAAVAGEGIFSSGADIEVPGMNYSIMSRISVLDSDADGLIDRLYAGDAGGQVWRVDLGDDIQIGSSSAGDRRGSTLVGRLANISTEGSPKDERRFHYRPAVAQVLDTVYSSVGEYDYVVISSGDRASPLDTMVEDRLYAFRDQTTGRMSGSNGLASNYPLGTSGNSPIEESDMFDASNAVLDAGDDGIANALGWYYSFDTAGGANGQKGLAAPIIIAGTILATSYLPAAAADDALGASACSAAEGSGVAHNFNILNAAATQRWRDGEDGSIDPLDDRTSDLGAGIPSSAIPIFTREGVTLSVGTGQGPQNLGTISGLPRFRTYWAEELSTF